MMMNEERKKEKEKAQAQHWGHDKSFWK